MSNDHVGLCYRCEHRARAWETGDGPRMQCSDTSAAVHSCYMYRPVAPVVLERDEGDDRPVGAAPMVGPRYHGAGIAEGMVTGRQTGEDTMVLWWVPQ